MVANVELKSIKFPGLADTYTVPQIDNTLAVPGKAADAKKTGDEITDLKSTFDDGIIPITKVVNWQSGYINSSGVINASSASGYAIVALSAGESVTIGTNNTNITIIGSTPENSLSVGDTVNVIQKTSSTSGFESYTYAASGNINIVLCVKLSDYSCYFYRNATFLDAVYDDIKNIYTEINTGGESSPALEWTSGKYIRRENNSITNGNSDLYLSNYINLKSGTKKIVIHNIVSFSQGWTVAFYNQGKVFLQGYYKNTSFAENPDFEIDASQIPAEAKYYVLAHYDYNQTYPINQVLTDCYLFNSFYNLEKVSNNVSKLTDRSKYVNSEFGELLKAGQLVSHRCMPFPENTLEGLVECIKTNGIRIHEMDLAFTSDNVPVLLHDTTINRTARNDDGTELSSTINIADITYSEASEYDFGIYKGSQYAGIKIPKLEDILITLRRYNCSAIIDILGHSYTSEQYTILHDLLIKTRMIRNVAINGNDAKLSAYAALYNDTPLNPSSSTNSLETAQSAVEKYSNLCPLIVLSGYIDSATDKTSNFFKAVHALDTITLLGMTNTVSTVTDLFDAGCDLVYSETLKNSDVY